jgi:hypothetical protein
VIDRCESLNVRIIKIEVFTTDVEPPSKVQMVVSRCTEKLTMSEMALVYCT